MNASALGRRATDRLIPPWIAKLVLSLVTVFLIWLLTTAWTAKEDATHHEADIQAVRGDIQRVLDVVCLSAPQAARQCKP